MTSTTSTHNVDDDQGQEADEEHRGRGVGLFDLMCLD